MDGWEDRVEILKLENPSCWRMTKATKEGTEKQGMVEEFQLHIQGILEDKRVPPIRGEINSTKKKQHLRQSVTLSGINSARFMEDVEHIMDVVALFARHVPGIQQTGITQVGEKTVIEVGNRIFTPKHEAPAMRPVEVDPLVDENGYIAQVNRVDSGFVYGDENVVYYGEEKTDEDGGKRVIDISPQKFHVGDIVDVGFSIMGIGRGRDTKARLVLRSVTLLDATHTQRRILFTFGLVTSHTAAKVPISTSLKVPTSTSLKVPTSTSSKVPTSHTSAKVPTSAPSSHISAKVPTSTSVKAPTSTLVKVPTSTLVKVPTSTSAKVPTSTLVKVPTSTLVKVPTSTSAKVPTSTSVKTPTSTSAKAPTSTSSKVPTSHTSAKVPTSAPSSVNVGTFDEVNVGGRVECNTKHIDQCGTDLRRGKSRDDHGALKVDPRADAAHHANTERLNAKHSPHLLLLCHPRHHPGPSPTHIIDLVLPMLQNPHNRHRHLPGSSTPSLSR
ncbi:hypothetical protein F5878DRAFT_678875 [Lentinula raphanica]|uniref:Uncharacterized protein n=1 Tax=Lentinula raphanica TaxID=153919 RepID=A0AA38UK62_9AGAR|nr:hypothetical protein F5878DRAFT_678875 [Lentinula raphanica]